MSRSPTPPDLLESSGDIQRLASALVDGTISPDEQAALERSLLADLAARDSFRRFMEAESILAWELGPPAMASGTPVTTRDHAAESRRGLPSRLGSMRRYLPGGRLALAAGLAATVLAGAWLAGGPQPVRQVIRIVGPAQGEIATLTNDSEARWGATVFSTDGVFMGTGPLALEAGEAQITFGSGAIVTLHAPVELEVLSAERVFLRHGRITPFVPPQAHGFTVVSPSGEIVDLGTEFTVGVDASGRTDVFVIDGEVDVAAGHHRPAADAPLRMTQGYGSRLFGGVAKPETLQRPMIVDHFDGAGTPLRRVEADADFPSVVRDGLLRLPIAAPQGRKDAWTRVILAHDFSWMAGRQSTISFKVTLPDDHTALSNRCLALVIDDGSGEPPMAWMPVAAAAVLVSPRWHVGLRIDGEPINQSYVFSRGEDAVGPYQVVMSIDDTLGERGTATWSVMVNGNELVRDWPMRLPARPRLQLQTFTEAHSGSDAVALVDDLSVSVSGHPTADTP